MKEVPMNKPPSNLRFTLLFGILLLFLAACIAPAPPATASKTSDGKPQSIGVASGRTDLYNDFDPHTACVAEFQIYANIYETLTFYNPPGSAEMVAPKLATSWQHTSDGLSWTFHLRAGVKFHDGTPLNAAAVKFSLERSQKLGACSAYALTPIQAIETPDDLTVVFKLSHPASLDLIFASPYSMWIMSPSAVGDKGSEWFAADHDAGSGPYQVEHYEPSQRVILARFDGYWGGWQPGQFDKVIYELGDDSTALEQSLRAGEIDIDNSMSLPAEIYGALSKVKGFTLVSAPSVMTLSINLNHRRAPTDNLLVRQALAYSFPYEKVIQNIMGGKGQRANSLVPANIVGHNPDQPRYTYDLKKAADLLAQAGYPNGGFDLLIPYDDFVDIGPMVELWRAELEKLGINVELQKTTWDARWALAKGDSSKAQHAYPIPNTPDVISPYPYLFLGFHSEKETLFNLSYYNNPAFDALIDEGSTLSSIDPKAAAEKYIQAQRLLDDDAAAIFVAELPSMFLLRSNIQGFVINSYYPQTIFWHDLSR